MEQERKGENMTETGMHTRLNTRKSSWLNGTGQKGGGIIYTSKTSWLNETGQKGGGIIYTSKTSWLNGTAQKGGGIIYTSKTSWLNGTGQKSDGIICTRKTPSALSRWALSYNMQSRIASQTREVFCADPADGIDHNEYS